MGDLTGIGWAHRTHNFWIGCTKVSPECDNCYAEKNEIRWQRVIWGHGQPRYRPSEATLAKPYTWNRQAEREGARQRVFGGSLMDWADAEVPQEWRDDMWKTIRETPWLTWIMLTKRHALIKKMLPADWGEGYKNVILMVSAGSQKYWDIRVPYLMDTPAFCRGVSVEPMIGPVTMNGHQPDWVIVGGETQFGSRPMFPAWPGKLVIECLRHSPPNKQVIALECETTERQKKGTTEIAPFFKQWGHYIPVSSEDVSNNNKSIYVVQHDGSFRPLQNVTISWLPKLALNFSYVRYVGNKSTGNRLWQEKFEMLPINPFTGEKEVVSLEWETAERERRGLVSLEFAKTRPPKNHGQQKELVVTAES